MTVISQKIKTLDEIEWQIENLLSDLGKGQVDGVAYDTAWVARLAPHYPGNGFEKCIDWLRQHQYEDGTWGAPLVHYHDRFISTLAAIVALREVGDGKRDERRVKRGEQALWHLVGKLNRDDSDTVGFPVLSTALAEEANDLNLDIPMPPIRYAKPYKNKVKQLLNSKDPKWRNSTLTFSLEALRNAVGYEDVLLEENSSVAVSPSASAALLLVRNEPKTLEYLRNLMCASKAYSIPAVAPIDIFESTWSINYLTSTGLLDPTMPAIRQTLDRLWSCWSDEKGVGYSKHGVVTNIDDTASCFNALLWGGYPVDIEVFRYYEKEHHFCCFHGETDPSVSAQIRLLAALKNSPDYLQYGDWIQKILEALVNLDDNGSFWQDKWHSSPYYVNSTAINTLRGIEDSLAKSRLKWILRTQNDDGGWGYFGQSTLEESAYCLNSLLEWNSRDGGIDGTILERAANYISENYYDGIQFPPLWIGKSLYTPLLPVQANVLSAIYNYYYNTNR